VAEESSGLPFIVMLCTGNAARSLMAARFFEAGAPEVRVASAGTHVVENQPMSRRTRAALVAFDIEPGHHRSHQLDDIDVADADLIVAMAAEHVRYVRRHHPSAASRTGTIRYLAQVLEAGVDPLPERIARLSLESVAPDSEGDVADPAGKEEEIYVECAGEISALVAELAPRLVQSR
jgi:protein-tyrosine-phosphatase